MGSAVVAVVFSLFAGAVLAGLTHPLVADPYPPASWSDASFPAGKVTALEGDGPGKKNLWAVVVDGAGNRTIAPRDVHNGIPRVGDTVQKQAGSSALEVLESGTPGAPGVVWQEVHPAAEPGSGLGTGLALWAVWIVVALVVSFRVRTVATRRATGTTVATGARPEPS